MELNREEVFKYPVMSVKEWSDKYGKKIKNQATQYLMDKGNIDFVRVGRFRFVVLTEKTLLYVPNRKQVKKYKTEGTPRQVYDSFMKQYKKDHAACSTCGSTKYTEDIVRIGYPFVASKPELYKDLNKVTCDACGELATIHSRVPKR